MSSLEAGDWLHDAACNQIVVCVEIVRRGVQEQVTRSQEARAASLMREAQQGDEDAYAELLVVLAAAARSYVRSSLRAPMPWIDDAVQETLVAVHHARHTFDGRRPFAPWFYAIAHHRFVDVVRREQRVRRYEVGVDVWPEASGPPHDRESPVDMEAVRRALASLPPRQREVVEALKLHDETVRDVAARLGMTMSSVKVTAHRGYRMLRRLLGVDLREE